MDIIPQRRTLCAVFKSRLRFFAKSSHNWYGKPTDHIVTNFIEEEFDILIAINTNNDAVLTYVAAMSHAKFKLGRFDEKDWIHDLLFEADKDKGLKFFCDR